MDTRVLERGVLRGVVGAVKKCVTGLVYYIFYNSMFGIHVHLSDNKHLKKEP